MRHLVCAIAICALNVWAFAAWAQDDADSIFQEANRFHQGVEVPQNHGRAAALYLKAAEMGHHGAQHQLGKYLFAGLGGESADEVRALYWLGKSAEAGQPEYIFDFARALEATGALEEAVAQYRIAADLGYPDAAVSLGVMYQNGTGVAQNFDVARQFYEAPAANGHPRAMNNLGLLYVRGDGVAQDYEKAARLLERAAQGGLQQAMTNLGVLYDNGFGVPQSDETAALWYRRGGQGSDEARGFAIFDNRLAPVPEEPQQRIDFAVRTEVQAKAGDPVAQFLAGWLALEQGDPRSAALWFSQAADRGHAPSMANLARLHFLGEGVLQDFVVAQMWVTLAMAGGLPAADGMAASLGITLTPAQVALAQQEAEIRWREAK
ncbi:hypothetical protein BXY66_3570 [Shimia isoporae]|uniref:TPR repeat protein n=1 Tax=Shimia isoporae TaxID=647720 RepID=A0A4R1N1N2_9RHOB|nr:SEL1-like repeat protein [Shimia isoporae]TCK99866.1 hypothetical protein BXY66_3570 [Shimia isoporae]